MTTREFRRDADSVHHTCGFRTDDNPKERTMNTRTDANAPHELASLGSSDLKDAAAYLGLRDATELSKLSPRAVMSRVILKSDPKADLAAKADAYVVARFNGVLSDFLDKEGKSALQEAVRKGIEADRKAKTDSEDIHAGRRNAYANYRADAATKPPTTTPATEPRGDDSDDIHAGRRNAYANYRKGA